ncbi:hypothetical protein [Anaeromicropila herbilytica]|uniref:Uncharacterized protein n=1 Tax=Anaeromicropila herbilytica TaxID=2785025 RepID=A0A7R7IC60_9FIRM|nr:hypothetical protein [Anaeromicropila herbilytica]BCN29569.1 hypothetical protein bsdtb5_08640 [Anaeromicropila herbilytica]
MNKDPVIRSFIIILLGIILFQMAFNLITGGTGMQDMNSSNMIVNTTSSLDNLVTGLMVLLIKILIIILLVAIIIAVFMWLKKNYFNNVDLSKYMKQNPQMKQILSITGAIVGLFLLIYVSNYVINPTPGYSANVVTSNISSVSNVGGFSGSLGITGVITFLVKILIYVFIISLIISLLAFLKKQLNESGFHISKIINSATEHDVRNQAIKNEEKVTGNEKNKPEPNINE